jgi:murein L,D-transpeptidase YcbB/YkuD
VTPSFLRLACVLLAFAYVSAARADDLQQAQVHGLLTALNTYRAIAQTGGWPFLPPGAVLEWGKRDPRATLLRERLRRSGDLTEIDDGEIVDAGLAAAISRFQLRHGLTADGRVGAETFAALNVTAAARATQIEVNLRRWQAAPELGPTYIRVNTAAQTLELVKAGALALRMPVIVGDRRHPTPEFVAHATGVLFNPPWNVPTSIVAKEIVPRLRRDPGYLARENIRILGRDADPYGQGIDWKRFTAKAGLPRLRQDPGPRNALGLIKFDVPNPHDVYLHDTPGKALFAKSVRAFSHGCIRVSQPRELALALLGEGWTMAMIDEATEAGTTRRVPLASDVPVHVAYFTAFIGPDGTVAFRQDIYGRDNVAPPLSGAMAEAPLLKERVGCSA